MGGGWRERLAGRRARHAAAATAGVLAACGLAALPEITGVPRLTVTADLDVSAGSHVELFLNDPQLPPLREPIRPGVRTAYAFDTDLTAVTWLRIDPTNVTGAAVRVHGVTVSAAGRLLATFGPDDVAGWASSDLVTEARSTAVLDLRATSADPVLATRARVVVREAGLLSRLVPQADSPDWVAWALGLGAVLLVGLAAAGPYRPLAVAAVALAAAAPFVTPLLARVPWPEFPVDAAVSRASFLGLTPLPGQMAAAVMLALGLAAGWAAARGRGSAQGAGDGVGGATRLGTALLAIAAIGMTQPDLLGAAEVIQHRAYTPQWDANNHLYWESLVHRGFLPFRDFWFIYGGTWLMALPLPVGLLVGWAYDAAVVLCFALAIRRLTGSGWAAALGLVVVLPADHAGLLPGALRYLLATDVVLAVSALVARPAAPGGVRLVVATAILAWLFEPVQLAYAAAASAGPLATVWLTQPGARRDAIGALARAAGWVSAVAVAALGVMAASGQFGGFVDFHLGVGAVAQYAAMPAGPPRWSWTPIDPAAVALVAIGVFAAAAVVVARRTPGVPAAGGLLGVALLLGVVWQKHAIRPIGDGLPLFVFVGLLILAAVAIAARPPAFARRLVAGLLAGLALAPTWWPSDLPGEARALAGAPGRFVRNLSAVTTERQRLSAANRQRFAPGRFDRFPEERRVAEQLWRDTASAKPTAFVLDTPALYVLLRHDPVWQANQYDLSPLAEQRRVAAWLDEARPEFVVIDRGALRMDDVPVAVRLPEIAARVAIGYRPHAVAGRFEILRRRAPDEPLPVGYFAGLFGLTLDFGAIPYAASAAVTRPCGGAGPEACTPVLVVEPAAGAAAAGGLVRVPVAGHEFRIRVWPGGTSRGTGAVPLERAWFWRVADHLGAADPSAVAPAEPGLAVRVVHADRAVLDRVLY